MSQPPDRCEAPPPSPLAASSSSLASPAVGGPGERAELLRAWALELGFDRAGVGSLEPMDGGEALTAWLERGDHAGMAWMERRPEVRRHPAEIFPGARSALCVALLYHPLAGEPDPEGDLWPRVARYARGRDYHNVMGKRLKKLARRVREAFPGTETRTYVDTGPVLERELAARSGLGAVGKNTLLLAPEGGSWFLLGELFTSLTLRPDPPVADLCGRCTACLDACPTGALAEPYRLVADRCISYWTIEHRGGFPREVRPMLEDWVFGCDLCQEACPVNTAPPPARDPAFALPPERARLDLIALLGLSPAEDRDRFQGSPLQRAGIAGLRRNAAVVMGNRGEERYIPALIRALDEEDPVLRSHAAWALGRIASGGESTARALRARLEVESDAGVRAEIRAALGPSGG